MSSLTTRYTVSAQFDPTLVRYGELCALYGGPDRLPRDLYEELRQLTATLDVTPTPHFLQRLRKQAIMVLQWVEHLAPLPISDLSLDGIYFHYQQGNPGELSAAHWLCMRPLVEDLVQGRRSGERIAWDEEWDPRIHPRIYNDPTAWPDMLRSRSLPALERRPRLTVNPCEQVKTLRETLQAAVNDGEDCPICLQALHEPVVTPCKHVFGRKCLQRCVEHRPDCPMCRQRLSAAQGPVTVYGDVPSGGGGLLSYIGKVCSGIVG